MEKLIFGPIPSRRLGRSIGVNNIPHKVCSYSCAYCQVGKAIKMQIKRQEFYPPDLIVSQVKQKLESLSATDLPDYITLVPDGEPTLDNNLGELIRGLKRFGLPVAVITNSSLLENKDVQADLSQADYISIKTDTTNPSVWKKINKPHKSLNLDSILKAILHFSAHYQGILVSETMLIKGINDSREYVEPVANFLREVKPDFAYIAIPTRPTAYKGTFPPDEAAVAVAYEIFNRHKLNTELLTGYEGNAFASSGNFEDDMLSITAVHPMRKDAMMELMSKSNATKADLNKLIEEGHLRRVDYNDQEYFLRKFKNDQNP
jgi:wyosine [tRNA(Phe)-imidazoG37] synthetase (radical SAM superfamily)